MMAQNAPTAVSENGEEDGAEEEDVKNLKRILLQKLLRKKKRKPTPEFLKTTARKLLIAAASEYWEENIAEQSMMKKAPKNRPRMKAPRKSLMMAPCLLMILHGEEIEDCGQEDGTKSPPKMKALWL